ncbi:hypothetical protein ACQKM1_15665 [Peribacillus frigoritolerans]|uniref:hypothetical protein n=1 Tax=Peribacillus frigoritolerans TaxID=450367 RepID=UPI003CFF9FEC
MPQKPKDTQWYIQRLKEVGREEYEPIEEYQTNRISIKHRHVVCGAIRKTTPNKMLDKNKNITCLECTKVTHEKFIERVKEIHGDRIKIVGEYKDSRSKIEVIHTPCGRTLYPYVNTLLANMEGCRDCSMKRKSENDRWSNEEYIEKVIDIHGNDIIPLEEYKGSKTSIRHYHASCGREWSTQPRNILEGHSCELCRRELKKYRSDEIRKMLHEIYQDEIVWIDGEYDTQRNSILTFKNTKCGHVFKKVVVDMINPYRRMVNNCPRCVGSKGEIRIEEFLMNIGVNYTAEYTFDNCRNVNPLPFDFAILKDDVVIMLIEYDGKEHFESVEYFGGERKYKMRKRNDQIKDNYCQEKGIKLIRIPYWDFENIEGILEKELGLVTD